MSADLAERVVESKHWRWLPGMLSTGGELGRRVYAVDGGRRSIDVIYTLCGSKDALPAETLLPDLADPCTLGGLLSLVRAAWGDLAISTHCEGRDWFVRSYNPFGAGLQAEDRSRGIGRAEDEAAALVEALLAAP